MKDAGVTHLCGTYFTADTVEELKDQMQIFAEELAAWPEYVPKIEMMALYRLREKVGSELIIIDRRGYRFNPEAVL